MGEELINNEFRYQVNCDIPATFATILLTMGITKREVILLRRTIFREDFLGNLEQVVGSVDDNFRIPFSKDYGLVAGAGGMQNVDSHILKRSLLEFRDNEAIDQRRENIIRNANFLFKWLHLKEAPSKI